MTEQLISLETAKLAKEKGFDLCEDGRKTYFSHDIWNKWLYPFEDEFYYSEIYKSTKEIGFALNDVYPIPLYEPYYIAPTQSLLQKWLREKFHIIVEVCFVGGKTRKTAWFDYIIYVPDNLLEKIPDNTELAMKFKIYEEALEVGLQKALKLIKI